MSQMWSIRTWGKCMEIPRFSRRCQDRRAWIRQGTTSYNIMCYNKQFYKRLDYTYIVVVQTTWFIIEHFSKSSTNQKFQLVMKGIRTISSKTHSSIKLIFYVLYVPLITQNFLSVSQMLEKGYKVSFENKFCVIKDVNNPRSIQSSHERKNICFGFDERGIGYKWRK